MKSVISGGGVFCEGRGRGSGLRQAPRLTRNALCAGLSPRSPASAPKEDRHEELVTEMRLGSGHTLETPEPRAVALEVRQAACGGLRRSRIPTRPMTTSISVSRHVYRSTTTVPFDHSPSPCESNKRRSCTPPLCIRSSLSCSKAPRIQCCCMGFQTHAQMPQHY